MLSRQFFRDAVEREILIKSPFAKLKAGSQKNPDRQQFITREVIDRVIASTTDPEWKMIIALARYGGIRVPSELLALRWTDIDWEEGRIHIQSKKTEHHVGHEGRDIPLFPELEPILIQGFAAAPKSAVYLIKRYRHPAVNLRTQFLRILERASIKPWPRLFQNLRSTRQTELTETYPSHVVCKWLGNSERIANQHYLQMTKEHFDRAAGRGNKRENGEKSQKMALMAGFKAVQQAQVLTRNAPHHILWKTT